MSATDPKQPFASEVKNLKNMNTFLKIVAIVLFFLGVLFCSIGTPYQGDMFWYGPYEKITKSEGRRLTRSAIVGILFVLAAFAIWKFAAVAE